MSVADRVSSYVLCVVLLSAFSVGNQYTISSITTQYIDLLVLIPWPSTNGTSKGQPIYHGCLELLPGARVAVQEINSRPDILPTGYKLRLVEAGHGSCLLSVQTQGLVNIVRYTLNKVNGSTIAAIIGLYCSTSTVPLGDFASIPQISLLQLSAANSPVFNQKPTERYRHLWRFLQSAHVYSDLVLHMMDEYDWQRIAVVSTEGNAYYGGIADALIEDLSSSRHNHKKMIYYGQLIGMERIFEELVLNELASENARIVFISAGAAQIASFLCLAYDKSMVYPNYLWILADMTLHKLLPLSTCGDNLTKSLEGSVMSMFNIQPENMNSKLESSGITYNDFVQKYNKELVKVREDYRDILHSQVTVNRSTNAAFLYDQVWAFALALNKAVPELETYNVTALAQLHRSVLTNILEKSLNKTSFKGATGNIAFNELREVKTPIDVYQVRDGKMQVTASRVTHFNGSCNLTFSNMLDDDVHRRPKVFSVWICVVLSIGVVCIFIFVTFIMACLIKNRHLREVKATSLKLSILIFGACYFLMLTMIACIILDSVQLSPSGAGAIICYFNDIIKCNCYTLVFITLYLKLRRIYTIFNNCKLKELGHCYDNWAIIAQATIFTITPNVLYIALVIAKRDEQPMETIEIVQMINRSVTVITEYNICSLFIFEYHMPLFILFLILAVLNIYLASKLTKIPERHFNNTRYVNLLIMSVFVTTCFVVIIGYFYMYKDPGIHYINVWCYFSTAINILYCQCFLFIPVLYKIWKKKWYKTLELLQ